VRLLTLAGPVVFSRLGIMTMGLTDAIVVGRLFAGASWATHMPWPGRRPASAVTVSIGVLTGTQVMTARAIGEGRRHAVGAVLRRA